MVSIANVKKNIICETVDIDADSDNDEDPFGLLARPSKKEIK